MTVKAQRRCVLLRNRSVFYAPVNWLTNWVIDSGFTRGRIVVLICGALRLPVFAGEKNMFVF